MKNHFILICSAIFSLYLSNLNSMSSKWCSCWPYGAKKTPVEVYTEEPTIFCQLCNQTDNKAISEIVYLECGHYICSSCALSRGSRTSRGSRYCNLGNCSKRPVAILLKIKSRYEGESLHGYSTRETFIPDTILIQQLITPQWNGITPEDKTAVMHGINEALRDFHHATLHLHELKSINNANFPNIIALLKALTPPLNIRTITIRSTQGITKSVRDRATGTLGNITITEYE